MIPHDYIHRPHSSVNLQMATPTTSRRGLLGLLYDAWNWFANVALVLLIIAAAMVVCYVIAPPVAEPDPSVSYLPQVKP